MSDFYCRLNWIRWRLDLIEILLCRIKALFGMRRQERSIEYGAAGRPHLPIGPNPAQAIHIRFARSLISILRCSYFIGANKTDSWIWEMHNEYRIYGWRRARFAADMSRVIW